MQSVSYVTEWMIEYRIAERVQVCSAVEPEVHSSDSKEACGILNVA